MRRMTVNLADPSSFSMDELAAIDALTAEEIEENARTDPDNPPLTEDELRRLSIARQVRHTREDSGLTQVAFAQTYRISLGRLRDWEQGRSEPDAMALAYLATIRCEPDAVARALSLGRSAA